MELELISIEQKMVHGQPAGLTLSAFKYVLSL